MVFRQKQGWHICQPTRECEVQDLKKLNILKSLSLVGISLISWGVVGSILTLHPQSISAKETTQNLQSKSNKINQNSLIWPTQGRISQYYHNSHFGIDITAPLGTPIVAAQAGEVVFAGWDIWGLGNALKIKHADGTLTVYGHNQRLLVRTGQQVSQGQTIAQMGSTGNSTGPHLHFEVVECTSGNKTGNKSAGSTSQACGNNTWDWLNPMASLPSQVASETPRNTTQSRNEVATQPPVNQANRNRTLYRVEVNGNSPALLQQVRSIEPRAFIRKSERVIQAGVFSQQLSANRRANDLRSRGISARIITLNSY